MEYRLLLNGKYRNCTFEHAESDRAYCKWVLHSTTLPLSLRLFQHYLNQRHGGMFLIGKHYGRFFDEVLHSDLSYTLWVMGLQDPCWNLRQYQDYVLLNRRSLRFTGGRSRTRWCCALL